MLEVDETFTTIWLSRSSEVTAKVRRWPQSPFGTIFYSRVFTISLHIRLHVFHCLALTGRHDSILRCSSILPAVTSWDSALSFRRFCSITQSSWRHVNSTIRRWRMQSMKVKVGRVVFDLCQQTEDRQTDILVTIPRLYSYCRDVQKVSDSEWRMIQLV